MVEDHEDSRAGLALWLEIVGHTVEASGDGMSALAVARARPPAIAIIDIGIPGLNGWELAKRLREAFGRHIGLIALTSRQSAEDRARSLTGGLRRAPREARQRGGPLPRDQCAVPRLIAAAGARARRRPATKIPRSPRVAAA